MRSGTVAHSCVADSYANIGARQGSLPHSASEVDVLAFRPAGTLGVPPKVARRTAEPRALRQQHETAEEASVWQQPEKETGAGGSELHLSSKRTAGYLGMCTNLSTSKPGCTRIHRDNIGTVSTKVQAAIAVASGLAGQEVAAPFDGAAQQQEEEEEEEEEKGQGQEHEQERLAVAGVAAEVAAIAVAEFDVRVRTAETWQDRHKQAANLRSPWTPPAGPIWRPYAELPDTNEFGDSIGDQSERSAIVSWLTAHEVAIMPNMYDAGFRPSRHAAPGPSRRHPVAHCYLSKWRRRGLAQSTDVASSSSRATASRYFESMPHALSPTCCASEWAFLSHSMHIMYLLDACQARPTAVQ